MIKKLFLFFAVIFAASSVLAVTVDLKQSYEPKETGIAEIKGNILSDIQQEQIEIRRVNVVVPVDFDVKKMGEDYFMWFVSPETVGNYTLRINNIVTTVNGAEEKIDYQKNFSVFGNLTNYYVSPGAIFTRGDFSINVYSNLDIKTKINTNLPGQGYIEINPGKNSLSFSSENLITGKSNIVLGKYSIPLYFAGNESVDAKKEIKFIPNYIRYNFIRNRALGQQQIILVNTLDRDINNIRMSYNRSFFSLFPNEITKLKAKETKILNVSFANYSFGIDDFIYVSYENKSVSLPVFLMPVSEENISGNNITKIGSGELYNCYELGGIICSGQESCSGNKVQSSEGNECCVGQCSAGMGKGSGSSWIGYVLGLILLAGVGYLVYRYKSVKKDKNPIERKITEAEKKMP